MKLIERVDPASNCTWCKMPVPHTAAPETDRTAQLLHSRGWAGSPRSQGLSRCEGTFLEQRQLREGAAEDRPLSTSKVALLNVQI